MERSSTQVDLCSYGFKRTPTALSLRQPLTQTYLKPTQTHTRTDKRVSSMWRNGFRYSGSMRFARSCVNGPSHVVWQSWCNNSFPMHTNMSIEPCVRRVQQNKIARIKKKGPRQRNIPSQRTGRTNMKKNWVQTNRTHWTHAPAIFNAAEWRVDRQTLSERNRCVRCVCCVFAKLEVNSRRKWTVCVCLGLYLWSRWTLGGLFADNRQQPLNTRCAYLFVWTCTHISCTLFNGFVVQC